MKKTIMQPQVDTHTHTVVSGHSWSTLSENVHAAKVRGLAGFCLTEHGPAMPGGAPEYTPHSEQMLPSIIDDIRVYRGIEANILDFAGRLDIPDHYLRLTEFAIASFHPTFMDVGTVEQNTNAYLGALQNPWIDTIGHADDPSVPCDLEALVLEAKKLDKLIELNNNSLTPHRPNSRDNITKYALLCKQHDVPVCVASDAHYYTMVGNVGPLMTLLAEISFPQELIINMTQKRFETFLATRKKAKNR